MKYYNSVGLSLEICLHIFLKNKNNIIFCDLPITKCYLIFPNITFFVHYLMVSCITFVDFRVIPVSLLLCKLLRTKKC